MKGRPKVYVVDDEPAIRLLIEKMLSDVGYDVEVFEEADSVIERAANGTFEADLLITDLHMPGRTGSDLAKALEDHRFDGPVIVMSGSSGEEMDEGFRRYHFRRIPRTLLKPFRRQDLLEEVKSALLE